MPESKKNTKMKTKELVFCGLFVALTAIGAFIQVPVPGMDYFTLQFLPACFGGFVMCYGIGLIYKYLMLNLYVGEKTAFALVIADCFPLDMPGDIVLCILASIVAVRLRPMARRIIFED